MDWPRVSERRRSRTVGLSTRRKTEAIKRTRINCIGGINLHFFNLKEIRFEMEEILPSIFCLMANSMWYKSVKVCQITRVQKLFDHMTDRSQPLQCKNGTALKTGKLELYRKHFMFFAILSQKSCFYRQIADNFPFKATKENHHSEIFEGKEDFIIVRTRTSCFLEQTAHFALILQRG